MTQCIGMGGKSNAEFHIRIESRGAPYLRDNVLSHGLLRWGRQFRLVAYYLPFLPYYLPSHCICLLPGGTERGRREACRRANRTRIKCKGIHLSLDTQMEDVYKHKRACLNLRTFITANMCSKQYTSWPTVLQELQ